MKKVIYLFFVILLHSCATIKEAKWSKELIKTDEEFSNLSKLRGMKYAFLSYMDRSVVLLKNNSYPVQGRNAFKYFQSISDSLIQLTWQPLFAKSSRKLGYTYGIYTEILRTSTLRGTYVTIWKKQKNGLWKFVLDTGNEGLGRDSTL